jgi:hypothetical protein
MKHVTAPEPSSIGIRGPELCDMWQRMVVRPASCLDLKPICEGIRSTEYQQAQCNSIGLVIVHNSYQVILIIHGVAGVPFSFEQI